MKMFKLMAVVLLVALFGGKVIAQNSICIANITTKLGDLKSNGDTAYKLSDSSKIMEGWAFGNTSEFGTDALKEKAFLRVFETMSEVCNLVDSSLSGSGIRGYNKLCGGIIRSVIERDFFEELVVVFGGRSNLDKVGFNAVMEQLDSSGEWINQGVWKSNAGLIYKTGTQEGHRISHLFTHTIAGYIRPDGSPKPIHSVFSVDRKDILNLIQ